MRRNPLHSDRGASGLEYAALIVVAALIIGALTTIGLQFRVQTGAGTAVCRILQERSECGEQPDDAVEAASDDTGQGDREKPQTKPEPGPEPEKHDCHGFLGCAWRGTKNVLSGAGGAAQDMAGGIKSLFTTNPETTGKGLIRYVLSRSPLAQGARARQACGSGDAFNCRDALSCMSRGMTYCLVADMVVDGKTRQGLNERHYGDATGRILFNGGTLVVPTKIPGLSKLGKGGQVARANKWTSEPSVRAPVAEKGPGAVRRAMAELRDLLKQATPVVSKAKAGIFKEFAEKYRKLSRTERTTFLDTLTPEELKAIYEGSSRSPNLRSEILESASPEALRIINPENPHFSNSGGWRKFRGNLWRDTGPSPYDVRQGQVGDCWCMAVMKNGARQQPELIRQTIKKNPNGTYTVAFGDGTRITVTDEIPEKGARVTDEAGWPAILEKAMAARWGDYDTIGDGWKMSTSIEWLTNRKVVPDVSLKNMADTRMIAQALHDRAIVTVSISDKAAKELPKALDRGIFSSHGYSVKSADPARKEITLENPHGPDSKEVVLTEKELMKTLGIFLYVARVK